MMRNRPPGFIERARLAWRFFRQGYRPPMRRKVSPLVWPAWREGQPQWQIVDIGSYIDEGFNRNSVIYSAILYKARSIGIPRLRAYRGDPEEPELLPPGHPLAQLIARPNTAMSWKAFQGLMDVYLNIAGNAYAMLDRPRTGGFPTALHPLRPDRVYIIPGEKGRIRGYVYVPEGKGVQDGVPILPEDIIHVKLPNPGDPLEGRGYGLSPISAMARSGDVDNMVTEFLKKFFDSGTMMNIYITFDREIDQRDLEEYRDRFAERYGGYEKWVKPGAFDAGGKVERFGMTFEEMGFETIDSRNEARMAAPFGVPLILLETRTALTGSTYTNKIEARRMFWEDTMTWEIGLFEDEYQYYLRGDDGSFVAFDLSDVPALRRDTPELVEAAYKLFAMGETRLNAYAMVGLEPAGESPGADVSYLPNTLIPVGLEQPEAPGGTEGAPEAEEQAEEERQGGKSSPAPQGWTTEAKQAQWKAVDNIARSWEGRFVEGARHAFDNDKREILSILTGVKERARRGKASIDWDEFDSDVRAYLSQSPENWRSAFAPLVRGVVAEQGARWAAQLGLQFDVEDLFARDWFNHYLLKFADQINQTTKEITAKIIAMGQAEGWSIATMQGHIEAAYRQMAYGDVEPDDLEWYEERMIPYRAELIARTETTRSSNYGNHEIFRAWGVRRKEWISTLDRRCRPSHLAANEQKVGIDQPFVVGGWQLMFPGDPNAPLEETANCRCAILPILEEAR